MSTREARIATCQMIKEDMIADAKKYDGKPFNGRIIGEALGNIGAGVAALANLLKEEMQAQQTRVTGGADLP